MADYVVNNFRGVKQNLSPLLHQDGDLLVCQNLDSKPVGAKTKRSGYTTFLGTVAGTVTSLFSWQKPSSGAMWNYMAADTKLYYSVEGTGAWTVAGNGTISSGAYVGNAALDEYMVIGDNVGSTRHTTNGIAFTDTTAAPITNKLAEFNQRIYAGGTNSTLYASELGSAIGWSISATNPSFSEPITGRGNVVAVKNVNSEVLTTKGGREMTHFDAYQKYQNPAKEGPAGQRSMAQIGPFWFWLNQMGVYAYDTQPRLFSRPVESFIYNNAGSGIAAGTFSTAPGVGYREDYYLSVGTVTSDLVPETVDNMTLKYNLPQNEWSWYQFANNPTAYHSFVDASGNEKLLFGGTGGQVYQLAGTATSDNGAAITAKMMGFLTFGVFRKEKLIKQVAAVTSPGCGATIQIAMSNTMNLDSLTWHDLGDLHSGFKEFKPDSPLRGRFCFYRLKESSTDKPFTLYSLMFDVEVIGN